MSYNKLNSLSLIQCDLLLWGLDIIETDYVEDKKYLLCQLNAIKKYHEEENAKVCYCGKKLGEHDIFNSACIPF